MGKRWRPFEVDGYRLGALNGQAVATWRGATTKRHRERLGPARTEEEARALLRAFVASRVEKPERLSIAYLFNLYVLDREKDGKQVQAFRDNWKALQGTFGPLAPEHLSDDLCRSYAQQRVSEGRSVGTAWTELGRLRSAMNWAAKRRHIKFVPYVWTPSKPPARQRKLTYEEADRLVNACVMPHVKLFVLLGFNTAARTEALLELKWDKVDFKNRLIDLRRAEPENPLSKGVRKGRAIVYMSDEARAALSEAKAGRLTEYVIEWNGAPVQCIRVGFMAACRRAGMENVSPHTLRHTAASWLATAGVDMEKIAKYLGHSNPAVTRSVYAKPDVETLATSAAITQVRR